MKIFIGYDSREDEAYEVCRYSLLSRGNVDIVPLVQRDLRMSGMYWRGIDSLAATEFSLTRFLVPSLTDGYAVFCDCDFLFLDDINKVMDEIDPQKAVHVVKHHYTPKEKVKMDGCKQTIYPRKNWSSFIVWNCDHPSVKALTTNVVNVVEPSYLHQFKWLNDSEIGSLSVGWNYLVDVYPNDYTNIHALHYTLGGPWFNKPSGFSEEWLCEREKYRQAMKSNTTDMPVG